MAYLRRFKLKKGYSYHLVFSDERSRSLGRNLEVAKRIWRDFEDRAQLKKWGIVDAVPCQLTLGDLKIRDLEQAKREAKDVRTREKVWRAIEKTIPANLRVTDITPLVIERLDSATIKRATLKKRHALLRYQLGESVRLGELAENPFGRMRPIREWDARQATALTRKQAADLLRKLERPTARQMRLLLRTASRPGERPTREGAFLVYRPHKRGVQRRFQIGQVLELILSHPRSWSRRSWDRAVAALGLEIRPHDLRHTAITWAAQKPGASLAEIQALGGWTSPAMAARYLHGSGKAMETVR